LSFVYSDHSFCNHSVFMLRNYLSKHSYWQNIYWYFPLNIHKFHVVRHSFHLKYFFQMFFERCNFDFDHGFLIWDFIIILYMTWFWVIFSISFWDQLLESWISFLWWDHNFNLIFTLTFLLLWGFFFQFHFFFFLYFYHSLLEVMFFLFCRNLNRKFLLLILAELESCCFE
jgi:hypothetical protein